MTEAKAPKNVLAKILTIPLVLAQLTFAFLAFWDLKNRDADEIKGPKPAWIPAILVNWVGPAAYFLFGIRR
ncbi:PLDc N-terminal domain-containing protein [Microbacterium koreense]|uniref:PLDc N-terminal domain-containing protein n=1 Tax=Microbacterium koreense TaxID=323761 RepID=A0ABW2ZSK2_9MICO